MRTTSNRELARQIGVSETAVRRAEKAGRIRREPDGAWDLARVQAAWSSNTDRAQQRRQRGAMKPVPEAAVGAVRETLREHGEPVSPGGMVMGSSKLLMRRAKMSPKLQSQIAKSKEQALAAFIAKKGEIDDALARLQALSDDHFDYAPDDITWSHVGTLEHYAELGHHRGVHPRAVPQRAALHKDLARGRAEQPGQHAQQGGLAAAGGTQQGHEGSRFNDQADMVERKHVAKFFR